MVKLIASDLDGTLLPEGTKDINPKLYDVIRALKAKGIIFVAASGREFDTIRTVMDPVVSDIYCISNNGARIMEYGNKELLKLSIDWKTTCDIIKYLRTLDDVFYAINTSEGTIVDKKDPEILDLLTNGYGLKFKLLEDVLEREIDDLKISVYVRGDAGEAAKPMIKMFSDVTNVTAAGAHWVDFIHSDADKGGSLSKLLNMLNIKREECWSFGDNYNDITLLEAAGTSFAAPDAVDKVKEIADITLTGSIWDAVLKQLETLL